MEKDIYVRAIHEWRTPEIFPKIFRHSLLNIIY